MRLTLRASAKINLDLRIGARRPDGYHDLSDGASDARPARHGDARVAARPVRARRRPVADAARPEQPGVARRRRRCGRRRASRAMRAVSASGSSNAFRRRPVWAVAAAMRRPRWSALSRVWRLRLPLADLMPVAATLGSDVPFFLVGGTALGLGRGEQVQPLANRPRRHVVLVLPGFGVSTADAYRWLAEDRAGAARTRTPDSGTAGPWTPRGVNDLERPGRTAAPSHRRDPAALDQGRRGAWRGCRAADRPSSGCFRASRAARRAAAGLARVGHRVVRDQDTPAKSGRKSAPGLTGRRSGGLSPPPQIVYNQGFARPWLDRSGGRTHPTVSVETHESRRVSAGSAQVSMGRGQAVRRGTLNPVFEGSNPSAPTNTRGSGSSGSGSGFFGFVGFVGCLRSLVLQVLSGVRG